MRLTSRQLARNALFVSLLAVSAHIKIPIGVVPITFQVMMVVLMGLLLDKTSILYILIGYIGLGLIGLPVFASGAGINYVLSPSFGFVLGFIFLALIIQQSKNKGVGVIVGYFVLYLIGLSYLILIFHTVLDSSIGIGTAILSFWLPFIPSDILSIFLGFFLSSRLQKIVL